ncbi:MAG: hypothetical protein LBT01_02420 [Spirochaetaceae bacterium]|jgi:hypothetical protein|nr:hypothetical protein [Spirochaetaceae bacterium]
MEKTGLTIDIGNKEGSPYHTVDMAFPHRNQWRYKGLPRDAFHVACIAHKTRLKNGLSRLGLPKLDRELAKIRIDALTAIQQCYIEKQLAAFAAPRPRPAHTPHDQS